MTETRISYVTSDELEKHGKSGLYACLAVIIFGIILGAIYPYFPDKIWKLELASEATIIPLIFAFAAFFLGRAFTFYESAKVLRERIEMEKEGKMWDT